MRLRRALVVGLLTGGGLSGGTASWATEEVSQLAPATWPTRLSVVHDFAGPPRSITEIPHESEGWQHAGQKPVRGITIGPIESFLQPGRGYGSHKFVDTLDEIARLGSNWISLTVFSRVWDKKSVGIDLSFEQPYSVTEAAVVRAVQQAHHRGLRVLLVPHLWLESGEWRAEIDPGDESRFEIFAENYQHFVEYWAGVAEQSGVDLFSVGVELRSWVTTSRAPRFLQVIEGVRKIYSGPLTYAANWDDAEDTVIWGQLDVIGVNAFYPLHWEDDASYAQVEAGGHRVVEQIGELARRYERSVLFAEFGYTTRKNAEIKPWLWPEELGEVEADPLAQERAYEALLGALPKGGDFAGTIVWRMYSDVADMSQEPDWGFSPWGKPSGQQLRRIYKRTARELSFD